MLPLELLAGYAAGAACALAAREPLTHEAYPTKTRYFAATALFSGGALVPAACVSYVLFPDWSLMYLADPSQVPFVVMLPLVIAACFGAPILGFLVTQRLLSGRAEVIRWTLLGAAGLGLCTVALGWNRLGSIAHYEAYHYGGRTIALGDSPAIVVLALIVPAVAAAFLLTRRELKRHIRALADVAEGVPIKS